MNEYLQDLILVEIMKLKANLSSNFITTEIIRKMARKEMNNIIRSSTTSRLMRFFHFLLVHGNWGSWGGFTTCTKICGGGTKTRGRKCDNPSPAYGGATCVGPANDEQKCNENKCPGMIFLLLYSKSFASTEKSKNWIKHHTRNLMSGFLCFLRK